MGVALLGGAKPVLGKTRGGFIHAKLTDEGVSVSGWLPSASLGRVFRRAKRSSGDAYLERAVKVRAKPRGRVIARVSKPKGTLREVRLTKRKSRGAVEIQITTSKLQVTGYVPANAVKASSPLRSGIGTLGGGLWGASHTRFITVPRGTPIAVTPGGPVFAVTVNENAIITHTSKRDGDWYQVGFRSRWRMTYGWVGCARLDNNTCIRN
jgi:hypothetical protein